MNLETWESVLSQNVAVVFRTIGKKNFAALWRSTLCGGALFFNLIFTAFLNRGILGLGPAPLLNHSTPEPLTCFLLVVGAGRLLVRACCRAWPRQCVCRFWGNISGTGETIRPGEEKQR